MKLQYSVKYATLLLVAFSLALASSSWFPPVGSGLTLILLIVGLRLLFKPAWLGPTAVGAVIGAVALVGIFWIGAWASGELPVGRRDARPQPWMTAARRYAIPVGSIAGGALGHAIYVWNDRRTRDEEVPDETSDDSHAA